MWTSDGLLGTSTVRTQEALAHNTDLQMLLLLSRRWDGVFPGEVWLAPNWLRLTE